MTTNTQEIVDAQIQIKAMQRQANGQRSAKQLVFSALIGVLFYMLARFELNPHNSSLWAAIFVAVIFFIVCGFYNWFIPAKLKPRRV